MFSLTVCDHLLRINDSTHISISVDNGNASELSYEWTANVGSIRSLGNEIEYTAPQNSGIAIIAVTINDKHGNTYQESTWIRIYDQLKQLVILKADDFEFEPYNIISPGWKRFITYIEDWNLQASAGITGISLEQGNGAYFSTIKAINNRGNIEFFNHGYSHLLNASDSYGKKYSEFQNTTYEYQREHLLKTQTLAQEKLGITLHAFGAPGNAIDGNTTKAIESIDEIKVWFRGVPSSKLNLEIGYIETTPDNPDFQYFVDHYNPNLKYLTLQIHPWGWSEKQFSQFKRITEYLLNQGATFITPYEYYKLVNKDKLPPC
jgi:peptidoglycan/xylan/chitin deacetylase (PgdA/CDA1 family)